MLFSCDKNQCHKYILFFRYLSIKYILLWWTEVCTVYSKKALTACSMYTTYIFVHIWVISLFHFFYLLISPSWDQLNSIWLWAWTTFFFYPKSVTFTYILMDLLIMSYLTVCTSLQEKLMDSSYSNKYEALHNSRLGLKVKDFLSS